MRPFNGSTFETLERLFAPVSQYYEKFKSGIKYSGKFSGFSAADVDLAADVLVTIGEDADFRFEVTFYSRDQDKHRGVGVDRVIVATAGFDFCVEENRASVFGDPSNLSTPTLERLNWFATGLAMLGCDSIFHNNGALLALDQFVESNKQLMDVRRGN